MTMVRVILRISMLFVIVWAAWAMFHGTREMKAIDHSIIKQKEMIDSLKTVAATIDREMKDVAEEIKELPEAERSGAAVKNAFAFAKRQEFVEGRITRSKTKIRNLEKRKVDVRDRMTRRAVPLILVWLLLGLVSWRLPRS